MPTDELIERLLREADPVRELSLPDADSLPARRVLARARRRKTRTARRVAFGAVAAVVLMGAGVISVARRDGHPRTSASVVCVQSPLADGIYNLDARTDDPVRVCAENWGAFGTLRHPAPVPKQLTACVDSSEQGEIKVYPGGPEVCAAHGAVGYLGPTDEQRRFGAFLDEAKALPDEDGRCMSPDDLRSAVRQLLLKHQLVGWTLGRPNGPEPKCMAVVGFVEPERLVVTN